MGLASKFVFGRVCQLTRIVVDFTVSLLCRISKTLVRHRCRKLASDLHRRFELCRELRSDVCYAVMVSVIAQGDKLLTYRHLLRANLKSVSQTGRHASSVKKT